jgi:Flp pilus assembly protein TadG
MLGASIISCVRAAARRFIGAKDGNIAVLFAIAAVPLISFVGAAIDYTRVNSARSSMQAALDSTALMLAKDLSDGTITKDQINAKAQIDFTALYTNTDSKTDPVQASYATGTSIGSTIVISGSGTVPTDFLKVAGFPNLGFGTSSTSAWGNTRMRVAMVLDNTGSMADNGKMAAMQKAASDMVDTLAGFNKVTGDVYISLIPFAKDVNVGTSNVGASWINWNEWEAEPAYLVQNGYPSTWGTTVAGSNCPFTNNNYGFTCTDRPATLPGAQTASRIPSSGTYAGYICPSMDSGKKLSGKTNIYYNGCYTTVTGSSATCGTNTSCSCSGSGTNKVCHLWRGDGTAATAAAAPGHSTWTGCINDRDQNYDTTNTSPATGGGTPSTQFYAEQWDGCLPATVTAMSNDFTALKDQIGDMAPSGNTNQAVGLAWGWLSLDTVNPPIKAPAKDSNYVYKNYIVLLSDGLNTQDRWSTSQSAIDARQEILCQNVKKDTINNPTIFTIQVNIGNKDAKSQVLQDCATDSNFQMITSTSQTSQAFQNILAQISKLRVAK